MIGLIVYYALFLGLGALLPAARISGFKLIGLRLIAGAAISFIALYVLHVLLRLDLRLSVYLLLGFSLVGFTRLFRRASLKRSYRWLLLHPATLLPLCGAVVILFNGGLDYRPYVVDEFTNWIGSSKFIHFSGGYEEVRKSIYLPRYTPGWRLHLLIPWQITGGYEPGWSAPASFVLYVGLIALVFDIIVQSLRAQVGLGDGLARLLAWVFILLFLAAELSGRLWNYNLMTEQPQAYLLSAMLLILVLNEVVEEPDDNIMIVAGLLAAALYLLKAANSLLVPSLAVVPLLLLMRPSSIGIRYTIGHAAIVGAVLVLPAILSVASWSVVAHQIKFESAGYCLMNPASTLTAENLQLVFSSKATDLGQRFVSELTGYLTSYKAPVSVLAVAGMLVSIWRGRIQSFVVLTIYGILTWSALYWMHLTCFGDYYFQNLNSLPRFSRFIVQSFHVIGIVGLFVSLPGLLGTRNLPVFRTLLMSRASVVLACLAIIIGSAWQIRGLSWSVVEVSTRTKQNHHPQLAEAHEAIQFVRQFRRTSGTKRPRVIFIAQGQESTIVAYANFFAMDSGPSGPVSVYQPYQNVSWAESPPNRWYWQASVWDMYGILTLADVIWPINVNSWMLRQLAHIVADPRCLEGIHDKVLTRSNLENPKAPFVCVERP